MENYNRIDIAEVPLHMRDIARIGLNYIISLDHDFKDVLFLQHSRVDILYLMVGTLVEGPLTQEVFGSEQSYTIQYYDNPLQPGIKPTWSDQNVLGSVRLSNKKKELRKELNWEEFQRRQKHALAMLENGPPDPMLALEEKYRAKMLATEHERNTRAILNQDIYENDAELDCNEFSNFLSKQKKERGGGAVDEIPSSSSSATTALPGSMTTPSGDPELDSLLAVTQIERCQSSADAQKKVLVNYESEGTKDVLGLKSDGVLFVAQGGRVVRNEGPPRPVSVPATEATNVAADAHNVQSLEHEHDHSSPQPHSSSRQHSESWKPAPNNHMACCTCFPFIFTFLRQQ